MIKLAIIVHDIRSTYNIGSLMRSADCFGVNHIYFSGYSPVPMHPNDHRLPHESKKIHNQIAKTALGAELNVPFSVHANLQEAIQLARSDGYILLALEQDENSKALQDYNFTKNAAFIIGNELTGVDSWTKSQCDAILEIDQFGQKESLNVAIATAIALYAVKANR